MQLLRHKFWKEMAEVKTNELELQDHKVRLQRFLFTPIIPEDISDSDSKIIHVHNNELV